MEFKVAQGSQEWLNKRYNLITATNVSSLLGLNGYNTYIELLKQKVLPVEEHTLKTNLFKIWGTKFEEHARRIYELNHDNVRVPGLFIHKKYDWLGATPDGIIKDGLLEIKCPIYKISDECPPSYYAQIQIQLEVTDLEVCKLFQCLFKFYYNSEEYEINDNKIKGEIYLDSEIHYWYLDDFLELEVKRDREWFKENFLKIKEFKETIDEYRVKGYDKLISIINKNNFIKKHNKRSKQNINLIYIHEINDFYNYTKKSVDPLVDYLNYYGSDKYIEEKDLQLLHKKDISWYIKRERNKFKSDFLEELEYIKLEYDKNRNYNSKLNIQYQLLKKTYECIKNKNDIILNSTLFHNKNIILKPDVLISTRKLNLLFNTNYQNNFYNIIDFKLSMNNNFYEDINFLKLVSYLYKSIGFNYFILQKNKSLILIEADDEFINSSLNWINQMKICGFTWNINKLHRWELFPNIKNDKDIIWSRLRRKLAIDKKDLSLLWYCKNNSRKEYIKKNITSYDDKRLDLKTLIFRNYKIVNNMIKNKNKISFNKLPTFSSKKSYFVDYESTNSLSTNRYNFKGNLVYLIGVGWEDKCEWKFKYFISNNLSKEEEVRIFKEFIDFLGVDYIIYHWASHEQNEFKRVVSDNKDIFKFKKDNWVDLCYLFQLNEVLIKDVFSFKLKHVASKLFQYGLINTDWDNNSVDGQFALVYPLLKTEIDNKLDIDFTINKIIKYNEIDCKVMWEMIKLIKSLQK